MVRIPKQIAKNITRFPKNDQLKILEALQNFGINPWAGDIVKIQGEVNLWRRRVGNYRIFFATYLDTRTVDVLNVERRTSSTY